MMQSTRISLLLVELKELELNELKPNYAELGRKYNLDPRTVKKYYQGYEGKAKTRNKPSKLDKYLDEIIEGLADPSITMKMVHEDLEKKYGFDKVGTYSNLKKYCKKKQLRQKRKTI